MTSKGLDKKDYIVSAKEIALILGVSTSRIRQLQGEKALIKVGHGKYDLPASIKSYIEYVGERNKPTEELDKTEEEAKWTRARRHKTELELQIMKGEVHRSEDVEKVMNDMLSSFRAQMLVIPGKIAPKIIGQADVEVVKRIVKDYVFEVLQELSDYDPHVFYEQSDDKLSVDSDEEKIDKADKEPRKDEDPKK